MMNLDATYERQAKLDLAKIVASDSKRITKLKKQLAEAQQKHISGYWACSHCDNIEFYEREIKCWKCGKGEMLYQDKELLRSFIAQATVAFKRVAELEQDGKRLDLVAEHLLILHPPTPSEDEFDGLWVVCAYELPNKVDCLSKDDDLRQAIDKATAGGE